MLTVVIRLLCLCWCLLATTTVVGAPSSQYETQTVSRLQVVVIDSSNSCDIGPLLAKLKTREGELFSQTTFDGDLKALSLTFARVEPRIIATDSGLDITLKIWPKPTIRAIHWHGNERIAASSLRGELAIGVHSIFDRQAFNQAIRKLRAHYVKKGFFEVAIRYDVAADAVTNQVDITITIEEGRAGHIQEIRFLDFTDEEIHDLTEMMTTKQYSFFTSWLTLDGTFSPEAIERDKIIILGYLQDHGYADATVAIEVLDIPDCHRIIVEIKACRGDLYTLGAVTFEGTTLFDACTVSRILSLREGSSYSPEKVREALFLLSRQYGKNGYIEAYANYEARLRPDGTVYDIHITIDEGEQYYVGLIKIFGNDITQNRVILHETLLKPGELFNQEKLRKTEERLLNIGYFKTVNVYAARGDGNAILPGNYRDLYIEVEEMPTGHIGFSLGYSTVDDFFGEIKLTERNFNYLGFDRLFSDGPMALRGGGEYANLSFSLGGKSRRYTLAWTKPFFLETPWSVGFDLERSSSRFLADEYDIEATSLTLHAGRELNPFLRFGWHYRLSNSYVPTEKGAPIGLKKEADIGGLVSAMGVALTYDATDAPMAPRSGLKSRLQCELAGLGGHHSFFSFGYLNSWYIPAGDLGVLQFKADFKFILPYGNTKPYTLPLDERYFLGGDETVRGFRPYRLGPKFTDLAPRGGISLQYYSVEYSVPVMSKLELFTFVDAGQLSLERLHFGGVNVAVGAGARISILPGSPPLTLGMGYPLHYKYRTDVKRFFLNFGGRF